MAEPEEIAAPGWARNFEEELDRVLASTYFRNSKQATRLLRHLVSNSIANNDDSLRERAIGVHVFGRESGYDTNDDSIVRVWVNELRKRLARYYQDAGSDVRVRFSIPAGSYRVEIAEVAQPPGAPVPDSASGSHRARPWWIPVVGGGVLLAAGVALYLAAGRPSGAARFWAPAVDSRNPVILCTPHPVVYSLSRRLHERIRGNAGTHFEHQTKPLALPPGTAVDSSDIVTIPDQYVTVGSSSVLSAMAAMFGSHRTPFRIRIGNDVSFEDFRHNPVILIGAFSNRWTMQLLDQLPFGWSNQGGFPVLVDRRAGRTWALQKLPEDGKTAEDYALVSRLIHPETGQLMINLAGITQYGTRAAGEFVTDFALLSRTLDSAPAGWEKKSLQIVLHVKVVGNTTAPATVLAVGAW